MVLGFGSQILEDHLLHKPLHQIPVLHDPVPDGPLQRQTRSEITDTPADDDEGRARTLHHHGPHGIRLNSSYKHENVLEI